MLAAQRCSKRCCTSDRRPGTPARLQLQSIRDECVRLRPLLRKEKNGTAVDRLGTYVQACKTQYCAPSHIFPSPHSSITQTSLWTQAASPIRTAFAEPAVAARLSAIVGEEIFLSDYPVRSPPEPAASCLHALLHPRPRPARWWAADRRH